MFILLLILNVIIASVLFFRKRKDEKYLPYYSFSLIALLITCIGFYIKVIRSFENIELTYYFFYATPFIFIITIIFLVNQLFNKEGLGIPSYLQSILSDEQKLQNNKYSKGILFLFITNSIILYLVYIYEINHPTPFPGEPMQYGYSLTHPVWQYIYLIPLIYIFYEMGLKKFSIAIFISSIIFPFFYILFLYFTAYFF